MNHCSTRILRHTLAPPKPPSAPHCTSPPNPISRRQFASSSSLLLFLSSPETIRAETTTAITEQPLPPTPKEAFLDVSIDGEPIGRIIIELHTDTAPSGADRFSELVSGAAGVSFRRKEFVKIMPKYIQHGGLVSYNPPKESNSPLLLEWEEQNSSGEGIKNVAKSVSIIVRDPLKPPPKMKLIAKGGKLVMDEETGMDPNGTEFVIVTSDAPELDSSALVVGKVVRGMDVVDRISQVKTVQENSSSPYFRVAKLIGDKRAVVAERGFNRPYSKVLITNCGLVNRG